MVGGLGTSLSIAEIRPALAHAREAPLLAFGLLLVIGGGERSWLSLSHHYLEAMDVADCPWGDPTLQRISHSEDQGPWPPRCYSVSYRGSEAKRAKKPLQQPAYTNLPFQIGTARTWRLTSFLFVLPPIEGVYLRLQSQCAESE